MKSLHEDIYFFSDMNLVKDIKLISLYAISVDNMIRLVWLGLENLDFLVPSSQYWPYFGPERPQ